MNQNKFFYTFFLFFILSFLLFIVHRGLILFGLFAIVLVLFLCIYRIKLLTIVKPILVFIFLVLGALFFYFFNNFYLEYGWVQLQKGIPLAIEQYQQGVINSAPDARANYVNKVNIKNYFDLFIFIPVSFIKYMFEPFFSLYKVVSFKDLIALVENFLRLFLISLFLFKFTFKKPIYIFIFLLYLFIEFLWSMGTINWGTAIRHHVPSFGLLIICSLHDKNVKIK